MTALFATARPVAPGAGWGYSFADLLGRVYDWNDARLTRRMLRTLSAEQLDDIGLCRDDIDAVAALARL